MGSDPHAPGPDDLDRALERVYRRGAQLRSRRKLVRLASSSLAIVVIGSSLTFGLVKVGSGKPDAGQVLIAPNPSDPTDPPPTAEPTEPGPTPSESSEPSSPSPEGDSSPAGPECHNSFEPECGPFYWVTPPGPNAPVVVSIDIAPQNPAVGEEVKVAVTVSDKDAPYVGIFAAHWGEEGEYEIGTALKCPNYYGPWTPPDPKPGRKVFTLRHVYAQQGSYQVWFSGFSWSGLPWGGVECYTGSPYGGGGGQAEGVIQVSGGSSPEPSPSSTESPSPSPASS